MNPIAQNTWNQKLAVGLGLEVLRFGGLGFGV